jgi:hypothetical protein
LHELAHLIEPGHGPRFWRLLASYPRTERARGYLDGVSAAAGLPIAADLGDDLGDVHSELGSSDIDGDIRGGRGAAE